MSTWRTPNTNYHKGTGGRIRHLIGSFSLLSTSQCNNSKFNDKQKSLVDFLAALMPKLNN